jgi:hypothetical protein
MKQIKFTIKLAFLFVGLCMLYLFFGGLDIEKDQQINDYE